MILRIDVQRRDIINIMDRIANQIKQRKTPNDKIYTPRRLAQHCISITPIEPGDFLLDAFAGHNAFYDLYPEGPKDWCEIDRGRNFFDWVKPVDWIITNPAYSILGATFEHSLEICRKGFGYLIGIHNLTPYRIEMANKAGFGLTGIHMCKVYDWFSMTLYVQFQKDKPNTITYDRIIY